MKGKQFYLMLTFDLPNICHVGEVNHCIYLASCAWTRRSLFRLLPTYVLPSLVKKKKTNPDSFLPRREKPWTVKHINCLK